MNEETQQEIPMVIATYHYDEGIDQIRIELPLKGRKAAQISLTYNGSAVTSKFIKKLNLQCEPENLALLPNNTYYVAKRWAFPLHKMMMGLRWLIRSEQASLGIDCISDPNDPADVDPDTLL